MKVANLGKKAVNGAIVGIAVGCLIELFSSSFYGASYSPGNPDFLALFANQHVAVLVERIVYALLGVMFALGAEIFEVERLSLASATALHFAMTLAGLFTANLVLKWTPAAVGPYLGFFMAMLVVYICGWLFNWLTVRNEIKKANEKIAK